MVVSDPGREDEVEVEGEGEGEGGGDIEFSLDGSGSIYSIKSDEENDDCVDERDYDMVGNSTFVTIAVFFVFRLLLLFYFFSFDFLTLIHFVL